MARAKPVSSSLNAAASLKETIIAALDRNKADDISSIDLAGKSSFADYMVIASGTSQRHVLALASHVQEALKARGLAPLSIEGVSVGDWVLIDAGDVVVHIFRPETRQFYNLEKMWAFPLPTEGARV